MWYWVDQDNKVIQVCDGTDYDTWDLTDENLALLDDRGFAQYLGTGETG